MEGLTKRYGDVTAVDGVDLTVRSGQVVGFLGPNGAGKSTTIKMLVGLVRPSAGRARVAGFDVQDEGVEARRHLGYLPEVVGLYENMTGRQFLHHTGRFFRMAESEIVRRTEELLREVGLVEAAGRKVRTYSKGMRQRIGLASALFHEPEVLILDEPLTGLDPPGVIKMRNVIRELGRERTVFLSSHELHNVESLCERVVIVDRGRVLADQPLEDVRRPDTATVFVGLAPHAGSDAASQLAQAPGVDAVEPGVTAGEWRLRMEAGVEPDTTLAWLIDRGVPVAAFQPRQETLEEAFIRITGADSS